MQNFQSSFSGVDICGLSDAFVYLALLHTGVHFRFRLVVECDTGVCFDFFN